MKKYTFTRSAIVEETYFVEAVDEADAWEQVRDGADPVHQLFLDYYTDDFVLEDVEDTPLTNDPR
jgi:hypothetical protein